MSSPKLLNLGAVAFLLSITAQPVIVPAGAELHVRLTSEASSEKPSGQPIAAVLIMPVFVNGIPAVAAGALLSGNTADAASAKPGTQDAAEQPATLRIQFTAIADQAAHAKTLHCALIAVDNARESIDSTGLVTGISASQTFTARLDQGIGKLAPQYGSLAELLAGLKGVLVQKADPSIDYKPGVELTLKLTEPLDWTAPAAANFPNPITPAAALLTLVNSQPLRTTAAKPPEPSDFTNLMFIGAQQQLLAAFHDAGWVEGDRVTGLSKFETARAIMEDRGYGEAPMSILTLDGRPPDLALQKQNNTFAMRHHIRIWLRPQAFNGKPVWLGAATHDIRIAFSPQSRSFTHGIDSHIDDERAKVVNDLLFTGYIHARALVSRAGIPRDATNATGDPLLTDGKIAVLEF